MINFRAIQLLKYKCNCNFYCLGDIVLRYWVKMMYYCATVNRQCEQNASPR